MSESKMAIYEFELQGLVEVEAPDGTDPDAPELRDRALEQFLSLIDATRFDAVEVNCLQKIVSE
tara:strand:+ start:1477 stop:1668 length:192 start_codon:yes stop_codon:yes gene_type:complete